MQSVLLAGIVVAIVGTEIAAPKPRPVDPTFSYMVSTMAVAIVGIIFVVRRTLVSRSAEILVTRPEEALMLNHWRTGCIATYALCEGLALFGLVLRFLGYSLEQSLPFYLGGFALLAFFRPRVRTSRADTPTAGI